MWQALDSSTGRKYITVFFFFENFMVLFFKLNANLLKLFISLMEMIFNRIKSCASEVKKRPAPRLVLLQNIWKM